MNTKQLKIFFLKGGQEQPNTASYNRFLMLQQMTALHFDAKVVLILRQIFKPVVRIFDSEFRFYYYLSLGSTIVLGLLKNIAVREPYIMLLIIIPGLYLVKRQYYTPPI